MENRVIKFRIRLKCIKESGMWKIGEEMILINEVFDKQNGVAFWSIDRDIWEITSIEQFTGLKDKSDKDIYEGDVLNVCNGSINGMEWMNKPYAVRYVLNKGFAMCMFCWDKNGNSKMDSTHWCEIIGNIYENPSLNTPKP